MSTARFQVRLLERISQGLTGNLHNWEYLSYGQIRDIFQGDYDAEKHIKILMQHGMVKKVGFRNRFLNPMEMHEGDETLLRVSTKGNEYVLKFYKVVGTEKALPALSEKREPKSIDHSFIPVF
jgi:hypothetical protein